METLIRKEKIQNFSCNQCLSEVMKIYEKGLKQRRLSHRLKFVGMFFMALTILNIFTPSGIWSPLSFCVTLLSIVVLVKNELPNKKQTLISILFGIVLFLAYTITYQRIELSSIGVPLVAFVFSLASFSIFNTYANSPVKLLKSKSIKAICISISIGIIVEIIWIMIRFQLSGEVSSFSYSLYPFFLALSPALYEEIAFRSFVFAICFYFWKGEIVTSNK